MSGQWVANGQAWIGLGQGSDKLGRALERCRQGIANPRVAKQWPMSGQPVANAFCGLRLDQALAQA